MAPFEGTFWALVVFCLLAAAIVFGIDIPQLTKAEYDDSGRPLGQIVKVPTFIVALISALFGYMAMNFLMTATPVTMRIEAFTDNNIVRVIQWHVVGMFAPGFFTGSLIQRYGVVRIIVLGSALLLGSVIVALSGHSFVHFFIALFRAYKAMTCATGCTEASMISNHVAVLSWKRWSTGNGRW